MLDAFLLGAAIFVIVMTISSVIVNLRLATTSRKRFEQKTREFERDLEQILEELMTEARRAQNRAAQRRQAPQIAWYMILGVRSDASKPEIKEARNKLVKMLHPDSASDGKGNPERLRKVLEAYKEGLVAVGVREQKASTRTGSGPTVH